MDFANFARATFALLLTLGLIGLGAVALRRFGPEALARFAAPRKQRRLAVVETLVLDPARRLVLVSIDGDETLLLLGEGHAIERKAPLKTKAPLNAKAPLNRKARA